MLAGELDLESSGKLNDRVSELRRRGITDIVLDLRGVDFIDSSGLRMLLALRNDATRGGHALTLIPPPAIVQRVFDITGTRGLFDWRCVVPSPDGCAHRPATFAADATVTG